MAVLNEVFGEEYDRLIRIRNAMVKERSELPRGYLSKKTISDKEYFYLQSRRGDKVVSSFVPIEEVPVLEKIIARRRQLDLSIKEINSNIKKLERVL